MFVKYFNIVSVLSYLMKPLGGIFMKILLAVSLFVLATSAFAQEQSLMSHFHLLNSKCEANTEEGPEMTPQSPPLDVDDPGTPGCNRWEINILTDADFTKGERHFEIPLLDINYGIGDNIQLKYEVPMEKTQTDTASETGVGHSRFGIKYMFYEDEGSGTQFGFYPQIDFFTPGVAKSADQESESSGNIVTIPLLLTTKVGAVKKGDVMLTANLGYNLSSRADTENSVYIATGVGLPVLKNLALMGEISAEESLAKSAEDVREELVKMNVGAIQTVAKNFLLFGSVGESLISSDHLNHTYALVGFRVLTDGETK